MQQLKYFPEKKMYSTMKKVILSKLRVYQSMLNAKLLD